MKPSIMVKSALMASLLGLVSLALPAAKAQEVRVVNAGTPGNNSNNLLSRLDADVLSKQPALVIVGIGTNDAINSRNSVPLPDFRSNLARLAGAIQAAGAKVLFLTPPPCYDPSVLRRHPSSFFGGKLPSGRLKEYQLAILDFCRDANVPVVKIHELFERRGRIGEGDESWLRNRRNSKADDGVHPTAEGYREIAGIVAAEVATMKLSPGAIIVCFGDSITYGSGTKAAGTAAGASYPAQLQLELGSLYEAPERP